MSQITNRQAICEVLMEEAAKDRNIVVTCSDSRGSASLTPFADKFPKQFVEVGIAEQNLVSISAGMAACGKKVYAASPASFLSTRSYEQVKVDVAYASTNVKLIGVSGGISYGALGMTHHSCQDIACMCALPGMRVYFPSDRFQTTKLLKELLKDTKPAYIRVSRSASEDIYDENTVFTLDKATEISTGSDVNFVACGEMVSYALKAAKFLESKGYSAGVIDMYCLKPLDEEAILKAAGAAKLLVTVEEHSPYGGLGSMVAMVTAASHPVKLLRLALPDTHIVAGTSQEVFRYYGLDETGIAERVVEELES